jgi:N-acetylglucosamine-6-phosphate deacetylase
MQIISADTIFTGHEWLSDHAVVIENNRVERLVPKNELEPGAIKNFDGCFIAPGLVDAQVYGAGEKLFSVYPDAGTLQLMKNEFGKEGTFLFLPTLATNETAVFKKGIDAVRDYWQHKGEGVYGLHLEGPWLNPLKRGAHVKEWIHAPAVEEVKDILEYGKGVIKMITIAPEVCSAEVIELILSYHIVISAGHSNAGFSEAVESFDKGISTVTHLFNAMSALHHREMGLVGAAFHHPQVRASIIPDGHHVAYPAVSLAKKIMGDRLFAITDAVTETGTGPYRHQLKGDKYEANGVLSGSALSMHKAFKNLVNHAGVEVGEALRMCSLYPAQVLRCDDAYGHIIPGARAQFLVLEKNLEIAAVLSL